RSLLLAEMMYLAGFDVRLAHRTLDDGQIDALLAAAGGGAEAAAAPELADTGADVQGLATAIGVEPSVVAAYADAQIAAGADCDAALAALIDEQSVRLAGMIPAEALGAAAQAATARQRGALADHWWVQYSLGGDWSDLDPSAEEVGDGAAEAVFARPDLPADLDHRLALRVVADRWDGQELHSETLVAAELPVADAAYQPITLDIGPLPGSPEAGATMEEVLAAHTAWVPAIGIGEDTLIDLAVSDTGETREATQAVQEQIEGLSATGGGLLGGGALGGGAGGQEAGEAATTLVAMRLEVEITGPGAEPRLATRTIYDYFGGAAAAAATEVAMDDAARVERAASLLVSDEIAVTTGTIPAALAARGAAEDMAGVLAVLSGLLSGERPEIQPVSAHSIALDWAADRPSGLRQADLASPTVLIVHSHAGQDPAGASAIDIVSLGAAPATADPAAGVRHGVSATLGENLFLTVPGSPLARDNAARAFALQPEDWTFVGPGDAQALADTGLAGPTRAFAEQDLAAGYALIVPPADTTVLGDSGPTYWRFDPATGAVLGIGPQGYGQNMREVGEMLQDLVRMRHWFAAYAGIMGCIYLDATGYLSGDQVMLCMAASILSVHQQSLKLLGTAINSYAHARVVIAGGIAGILIVQSGRREAIVEAVGDILANMGLSFGDE
ncbi:MAG: hypothetical protein KDA49_16635, partial [Rhodospirillaceae bacterium]|nr:hypothetical protein [Rhodospirillaceae bacterium]